MPTDIVYKKNYLTNVVARIDFISPLQDLNSKLPPEISKTALINFPIYEPQKVVARQLQITSKDFQQKEEEFMQWVFHGKDREKKLWINPSAVFVEYTKYVNYKEMRDQFMKVLRALFDVYGDAVCSRIGLRYINNIVLENGGDPLSWEDLLNEKLLSVLTFYPDKKCVARSFHNLELKFSDYNLGYQFGIINPDYPAVVKQKSFILDLDAYYQGNVDHNTIGQNLDKFHDCIQEIFELSITNKMRELLNA